MLTSNSTVFYDVSNNQLAGATGAAVPAGALQAAGSDGTNLRALLTDTGGRQVSVGAAAAGSAPVGNPLYVAGSDGTNVRALLTDAGGRQVMVGAAADGSAVTGNPVLMGGQDGTNAQSILVDTSGRQRIVGGAADGSPPAGDPVLIAGFDGTNVQTLLTSATGRLLTETLPTTAGTATLTNVAASITSVTVLAANASRLGAIIVNDGTAVLFAKFGATASSTSFTVRIPAGGYYEIPFGYTGIIDGIWTVANGSARVTELTA